MATDHSQSRRTAPSSTVATASLFSQGMSRPRCTPAVLALACLMAACLTPFLSGCNKNISDKTVTRISVDDVARRLEREPDAILIVDARSATAYSAARVPGARRLDFPDIDPSNPDPSLKRYRSIIVYGQNPGAGASMALTKRLMAAGYDDVKLMEDGFDRWSAKGYRIDTSKVEVGVGGTATPR